ncbi:MAG TPA: replication protein [Blastocatellia bacterium]|nr:replication protein [Blastocatellia bacterium]
MTRKASDSLPAIVEVQAPTYTQIPNVLIGLMPQLKEAELRVTLAIARETFGWHRKEKSLSLTRLSALTGLSRQGVLNGIEEGLARRVIGRRRQGNSFRYWLLVNEVDQSIPLTSQPSGPNQSTTLTTLVNEVDQKVVNEVDTANKERKKDSKTGRKERGAASELASLTGNEKSNSQSTHPAIQAVRKILGRLPNKMTWADIIELLGDSFDMALLELCAREWSKKTANMHNLVWLFEWYPNGGPGISQRHGGPSTREKHQFVQGC